MGLFNCVNYHDTCKECGTPMGPRDFQTKICKPALTMDTIEPYEAYSFSGWCPNCRHTYDYIVNAEVEVEVKVKYMNIELIHDATYEEAMIKFKQFLNESDDDED